MPCLRPVKAYKSLSRGENGKYAVTFNPTKSLIEGSSIKLPCGSCQGCYIDRSRDWAMRCYHESQMHSSNSFITLTYADEHLPPDYGVHVRTWQLFMKKLRKSIQPINVRFFACGEYGEKSLRPHYHALIFGYQFPDLVVFALTRGNKIYTSKSLDQLWPYGLATIGNVTYQTAAYVARYVMKKINGDDAKSHYLRRHPITQEIHEVRKEFCVQSRRPGIGATWFDKYKSDAFPSDFLIVNGRKHSVPRYYTLKLEEEEAARVKKLRKRNANKHRENNTPERLKVREEVLASKISQLKREL